LIRIGRNLFARQVLTSAQHDGKMSTLDQHHREPTMYDLIETSNESGRSFSVVNSKGRVLRTHRYYEDALAHLRRLHNARIRQYRDNAVRACKAARGEF
jgi:hypothetical protein